MVALNLTGVGLALVTIFLFGLTATVCRWLAPSLRQLRWLEYYWLAFTILTGVWEVSYLYQYETTIDMSKQLLAEKEHIWLTGHQLSYLWPWKFATLFYAEYGAYADREYMTNRDTWSHIIEGSHWGLCAMFSLLALVVLMYNKMGPVFRLTMAFAMGCQLMNSVLYLGEYFIQMKDINSPNYNSTEFPAGEWLLDRPFMWINVLWTLMPSYIMVSSLWSNSQSMINNKKTLLLQKMMTARNDDL